MIWGTTHIPPIFWKPHITCSPYIQWSFQNPKMEVLYHIRPYIGLIYGRYLQFRILKFPYIYIYYSKYSWVWISRKAEYVNQDHVSDGLGERPMP